MGGWSSLIRRAQRPATALAKGDSNMARSRLFQAIAVIALLPAAMTATRADAQANFVLVNQDPAGSGLNDPTPATPTGGNPGRTIGEQRRIAYQYAMDLWGALLSSNVDIRVQASFAPLECGDGGNVLGGATEISSTHDFPNAPKTEVAYPAAMANALAGKDLVPASDDIKTMFNSDLATKRCGNGKEWYYGLHGNAGNKEAPNFLNVIMHEIGHGLGFNGNVGFIRGAPVFFGRNAYNDLAFSRKANAAIGSMSLFWNYSDIDSAVDTPWDIVWTGKRANESARLIAEKRLVLIQDLSGQRIEHFFTKAYFGGDVNEFPEGEVVLVKDAVAEGADPTSYACEGISGKPDIANADALRGKIVLIDRGNDCEFGRKSLNAQRYGAIAVIIANNVAGARPLDTLFPGADGGQVTIPVVGVSQATGATLRAGATPVELRSVARSATLNGMDAQNRIYLYSDPVSQAGSVVSHIDTDMTPNALMEPFETPTLDASLFVDIALDMYQDMGWPTNRNATARLGVCDTGIPVIRDVGLIPGANLIAQQRVCRAEAGSSRAKYQQCMNNHALWLHGKGMLTNGEVASVRQCLARQDFAAQQN